MHPVKAASARARRLLVPLTTVVMTATLMSGCGTFQNDSDDSARADKLVYWSMWERGEPQSDVLQAAIDDFEEEEGIEVDVQWAGREVSKKVQTGANTGDVPDLVDDAVEQLLAGAGAGVYRGLDSVYERTIPGEDQTVAEVVPSAYVEPYRNDDGELIVVPHSVTSTSLWYDANRFPDVASSPPQTWEEFTALVEQMKANGETPFAADGTIPDYNAYWIAQLVERTLGPGWLNAAAKDKTGQAFAEPKFLEAAQRLEALVSAGTFMEGYQGSKLPAQEEAWAAGDASFLLMGSWAPLGKEEVAREGAQWRTFPVPLPEGGVNTIEANLLGFGVPSDAKNAEAAEKFIAFFMNADRLAGISTEANQLTPREDIDPPADLADVAAMLAQADSAHRYLDGVPSEASQWWSGVFLPLDDQLFFGEITAEEFVERLSQESAEYWKNNE